MCLPPTVYIITLHVKYAPNSSNIVFLWNMWTLLHDDVIKLKHFPRYWPFVRGIHRSPVDSPHKGQWRGALIFLREQTVKQTIETRVILDTTALIMPSL